MGEVVHSLHEAAPNAKWDEEHNPGGEKDDVIARGQVEVIGKDWAGQDQQQTYSASEQPGTPM